MDRRPVRRRQVRRVDQVLHADRQPAELRPVVQRIDAARLSQRAFRVENLPGLDHGLALCDADEALADEIAGGELTPREAPNRSRRAHHAPHQARARQIGAAAANLIGVSSAVGETRAPLMICTAS